MQQMTYYRPALELLREIMRNSFNKLTLNKTFKISCSLLTFQEFGDLILFN